MQVSSNQFVEQASEALQQPHAVQTRDILGAFLPPVRDNAAAQFGDFQALRDHVEAVRKHALENLDHYLAQYEEQARDNGNAVHFARSGDELNNIVLDIVRRHDARQIAKGKSMITEETGLNAVLESAGLTVTETDLGEYIIQQAGEKPSHIVGPALHKSPDEIRELFLEKHNFGPRELEDAPAMVEEARRVLREHFLAADIGIIGANALIAENGYSMLVTNEGNGDLCANLPPVLIVCTSVDRILPRAQDAMAMLRLLVRSTTGQPVTCYTSFYSGPRRQDDPDGPVETHVILLDNGRSDILASDYSDMLQCIRCGACLNHCPVYISAGGHAYGSVYPGPMGSVLTPLLSSLEDANALPNACTSCGRCAEVCPANIPLPDLLRDLRHEEVTRGLSPGRWRFGLKTHAWLARHPGLYRWLTGLAVSLMHRLGRKRGGLAKLPMASGWTSQRDIPTPEAGTFMQQYRQMQDAADD